jgi:hypothetical protein
MTITTVRINHTSSFGGSGDERNPKEKFIDYCEKKYFLPDIYRLGRTEKAELTQAELVEKQKCDYAINQPVTTEYYLFIGVILIPFLFFVFCNMKGYLFIKKAEREEGEKVNMSLEMSTIALLSFVLTTFVWGGLYILYILYLYNKYQY